MEVSTHAFSVAVALQGEPVQSDRDTLSEVVPKLEDSDFDGKMRRRRKAIEYAKKR
jgi:hypothetical protein